MPYRRHYYKRPINKDKYSVEQTVWRVQLSQETNQQFATMVSGNNEQGMRKVKHLTVSIANMPASVGWPLYYALVYVPSGYTPNQLNIPLDNSIGDLYSPNQYVMSCGVLDTDAGPMRIHCPLSRNLNSGDSIALIIGVPGLNQNVNFTGIVRYAITLQ